MQRCFANINCIQRIWENKQKEMVAIAMFERINILSCVLLKNNIRWKNIKFNNVHTAHWTCTRSDQVFVYHSGFIHFQYFSNFFSIFIQVQYSWLWKLANVTQSPYSYVWMNDTNTPEIINGPARKTMYVAALYFTMTCMTSVCLNILNVYWRTIQHIITHKWEHKLQFPLQLIIYLECWFFPFYCVALDLYKCFQWQKT